MRHGKLPPLATLGALLTVTALAFEPFTQQIMEFPSRDRLLTNVTVPVPFATSLSAQKLLNYTYSQLESGHERLLSNESDWNWPIEPAAQLRFNCPSANCQFPERWTLASCTECQDMELPGNTSLKWAYSATVSEKELATRDPLLSGFDVVGNFTTVKKFCTEHCCEYYGIRCSPDQRDAISFFRSRYWPDSSETPKSNASLEQSAFYMQAIEQYKNFSPDQIEYLEFICSTVLISMDNLFSTGPINPGRMFEGPSSHDVSDIITDWYAVRLVGPFPSNHQELMDWEGRVTIKGKRCKLSWCARHITEIAIRDGKIINGDTRDAPLQFDPECETLDCSRHAKLKGNDQREPSFYVDEGTMRNLQIALSFLTEGESLRLEDQGVEHFARKISFFIDSYFLSDSNLNASSINGHAIGKETYVKVRWVWTLLPGAIVLSTFVFIALMYLDSWQREQLYKSSVLPGYFHNLEGWDSNDMAAVTLQARSEESDEVLVKKAKRFKARLRRNSFGELKFMKDG